MSAKDWKVEDYPGDWPSRLATPIPKQICVLDAGSWTVTVEEGQRLVTCNPELFDALLAVAKALGEPEWDDERGNMFCPCCGCMDGPIDGPYTHATDCPLVALDAAHPDWRTWA